MTESDLIKACLRGDRMAQRTMYAEYQARLYAVVLRYAESKTEADDIMQDGWVKIFRDLKDYRPIAPLFAWMRTVMVRTCLECIRKKKSRVGRGIDINEAYSVGRDESISSAMAHKELISLIQMLPESQRIVFNMYVIDGFTHKEIAASLGISEANSKMRLNRARKILRKQVERLFEIER